MDVILAVGILMAMFFAGLLLGFVGAGGSGFIISILSTVFGLPIHTALGTALSAMIFSSLSGTISHYREGNIVLKTGLIVGGFGAVGAWICSQITAGIPEEMLSLMTSGILFLTSGVLWYRMFIAAKRMDGSTQVEGGKGSVAFLWVKLAIIGIVCGSISGMFGIGATLFIQISLMTFIKMRITQAVGTTMMVIIPIAIAGGAGFYGTGHLDLRLLGVVLIGIMTGSYIGAKFTKRLPINYLKTSMVLIPMIGAILLLF